MLSDELLNKLLEFVASRPRGRASNPEIVNWLAYYDTSRDWTEGAEGLSEELKSLPNLRAVEVDGDELVWEVRLSSEDHLLGLVEGLALVNFKSWRHLDLPLRPLTVLLGKNGAGKTSVLEALAAFSRARELKLPLHSRGWGGGRIQGRALRARASFLVLRRECPDADAYVFQNDTDGEDASRRGIEEARDALTFSEACVLAIPHPELEAWLCAAFQPADDGEASRLIAERDRLNFDPVRDSHRLTAGKRSDPKDAKRVLKALCGEDARDYENILGDDLPRLEAQGEHNGLGAFVQEARERLPG